MDKNVEIVYKRFLKREYRNEIRTDKEIDKSKFLIKEMPFALRVSTRFDLMVEEETPIVYENDRIGFYRTVKYIPPILLDEEIVELSKKYLLFDRKYEDGILFCEYLWCIFWWFMFCGAAIGIYKWE